MLPIAAVAAMAAVAWLVAGSGEDKAPAPASRPAPPTLHATPATLAQEFAKAKGGETILLAAGDYGTFRAAVKPETVTVKAQPGVRVRIALELDQVAHVAVEGATITSAEVKGAAHDVRIAHNRFVGPMLIRADQMRNAGIVLDGNTHARVNRCAECFEGRVNITGQSGAPAGITIQNSTFGPGGNADGIQTGGDGVRILNNEFVGIKASHGVHSDAIQLYGSRRTLIRGNWIHGTATGIMAPDGTDHEVIEDNVIDPGTYPFAVMIGNDNGSVIRHNTLPDGECSWGIRCGVLRLSIKPGSSGTVVQDNVLGAVGLDPGPKPTVEEHNLVRDELGTGAHDVVGLPTYAGGAEPDTWGGYELTQESLGKGAASDGRDIGAGRLRAARALDSQNDATR